MGTESEQMVKERSEPPGSASGWNDWKWQLKNSIVTVDKLYEALGLNSDRIEDLKNVVSKYPLRVTPYYLSLVDKANPADPIAAQSAPSFKEDNLYFDTQQDPLGEEKDSVLPGLVHRYPDRALITLTNLCPVYCRHCTRKREWCDGSWMRSQSELADIYKYISQHAQIRDVILSGGDPLILSTNKLDQVLASLRQIKTIEIIRIGTRCPVVLPQRIDDELVSVLRQYRPLWINTHFNHPNEITKDAALACDKILCAGIPINNQTVLLKGINDDAQVVTSLCQKLLKIGVRPYYLFQCDPVSGTGHFRTSIDTGLEIIKKMRGFTSGLCVPTYVVDGLDGQGKVPLQPDYVISKEKEYILLKGYKEELFKYYNPES